MFLKDHLKDSYNKASLEKNSLLVENIINIWAHRFGVDSLNDLFLQGKVSENVQEEENQDQFNLIEEVQEEENQDQLNLIEEVQEEETPDKLNLELLDNVPYQEGIEYKISEAKKSNNNEITNKETYETYKNQTEYIEIDELPLPNIKNLRKWINNEKKAS